MKLVVISDTHGQEAKLKIPQADILVHCGDFSNLGTEQELKKFGAWLATLPNEHIFISPGNHDGMTQEDPVRAKEILEGSRQNVRLMLHESLNFAGHKWFFSPWTPEYAGWWWMLERFEIAEKWAEIPDDTEILITHGPPKMILDTVERDVGVNAGCTDLAHRIQRLSKLKRHFFGHLHHSGSQTVEISGVKHTNAAALDDRNNFVQDRKIVEVDL